MALDLAQEAGRELLLRLLATADVFIENFKTGTLERWGLGRGVLERRFPRLVHCRVSGFGADGPLGGLPGYDAAIQASAGIMSVNGEPGGAPLRVGLPVVDMATGLNAVIGILMALHERASSGKGQFVEATLYERHHRAAVDERGHRGHQPQRVHLRAGRKQAQTRTFGALLRHHAVAAA